MNEYFAARVDFGYIEVSIFDCTSFPCPMISSSGALPLIRLRFGRGFECDDGYLCHYHANSEEIVPAVRDHLRPFRHPSLAQSGSYSKKYESPDGVRL